MFQSFRFKLMEELISLGKEVSSGVHSQTSFFLFGLLAATGVLGGFTAVAFMLGGLLFWAWVSAWTWVAVLLSVIYMIPVTLLLLAYPTKTKEAWRVIKGDA